MFRSLEERKGTVHSRAVWLAMLLPAVALGCASTGHEPVHFKSHAHGPKNPGDTLVWGGNVEEEMATKGIPDGTVRWRVPVPNGKICRGAFLLDDLEETSEVAKRMEEVWLTMKNCKPFPPDRKASSLTFPMKIQDKMEMQSWTQNEPGLWKRVTIGEKKLIGKLTVQAKDSP